MVDEFNAPTLGRHTYDAWPGGHVMALLWFSGFATSQSIYLSVMACGKDQWGSILSLPIASAEADATLP